MDASQHRKGLGKLLRWRRGWSYCLKKYTVFKYSQKRAVGTHTSRDYATAISQSIYKCKDHFGIQNI